jgi:hypothetical protein
MVMGVQRRMYLDGKIGISGSQNSLQRVSQYMAMLDQAMEQVMCLLSLIFVLWVRLLDLVLCVCRRVVVRYIPARNDTQILRENDQGFPGGTQRVDRNPKP